VQLYIIYTWWILLTRWETSGSFPSAYLLEELSHLKLILSICQFSLDLSIGVVDNSEEHVEQDEEDEEHIEDEVNGSENTVSRFQFVEVKVSQNDTEQSQPVGQKLS